MRLPRFLIVPAAVVVGGALPAQEAVSRPDPPTAEELRSITDRGRRLAQYDRVAAHATDAVLASQPAEGRVTHYIPRRVDSAWVVAFGRVTPARDAFLVAYEARLTRGDSAFRVADLSPARADTGYFLRAARAIDLARERFGPVERPYNVAALPADSGEWWVYVFPAATQHRVWPLGADERFRVSADGREVRARRRMHKGIIEYAPQPDQQVEIFTHAAILDNVPEDTDVFAVLARTPHAPELIVTDAFVYRIELDGSIFLLGRRTEVLGPEP
jgi:hypothetical protein